MSRFCSFVLIFLFTTLYSDMQAQQAVKAGDQHVWVSHMLQSDARKLLNFMSPMVDVELPNQRGAYNHSQLQTALTTFFRQHPPSAISIDQYGALNPRNDYFIGTYTSLDTEFRLYIQAEKKPEGHKIFSISILRK